jgi:DNA repair ATPase RecN
MDHPTQTSVRLGELLAEELVICEALLAVGQAAHQAFEATDPQAVQASVGRRRETLERLAELEREASILRAQLPSPPAELRPHIARLRNLARRISAQEATLNRAAGSTLGLLRERLKGYRAGSKGLRGYRGSVTVGPRFSDRRG